MAMLEDTIRKAKENLGADIKTISLGSTDGIDIYKKVIVRVNLDANDKESQERRGQILVFLYYLMGNDKFNLESTRIYPNQKKQTIREYILIKS